MYCGEAYVTKVLGPEIGGWVHCGRSSGDLVGVSYRVDARDAIWTVDYLLELLGALMGTAGALGKLADDLEIWHTSEFSLIEQPDAFCGTSSIMPQKKNSLGTECVRGLNGDVIGNVMAFLAVTKGQSESGESWAMAPFYLYNAAESCLAALQIMEGIVRDLKVNKEIMKERAGMFWTQATTLANTMVREKKIPFRMAHQIVGGLVKTTYEEGKKPEDVTSEMVDKAAREFGSEPLHLDDDTVRKALDPPTIVASKKAIGGTAPERVKEDIASGLKRIKEDEKVVVTLEAKLATAEKNLGAAIDRIIGEHRQ